MNDTPNGNELTELMKTIKASNREQETYFRKQYRMSQITAVSSVIILALVIAACMTVIPRINALFTNMETVLENVQVVSDELAGANLDQMITNVDQLVTTSQTSVDAALQKINDIDIVTLNKAIRDLSSIIRPIAKIFGGS